MEECIAIAHEVGKKTGSVSFPSISTKSGHPSDRVQLEILEKDSLKAA
jgi:hypothetical protein